MLRVAICVILVVCVVDGHFHWKRDHNYHKHFSYDMGGFHGHSSGGSFMFHQHKPFAPPSPSYGPPGYGPPPPFPSPFPFPNSGHNPGFPSFHHGPHGPHGNAPKPGPDFDSMNMMPFHPMSWGANMPFNPPNGFNAPFPNYPNHYDGAVPPNYPPNNVPNGASNSDTNAPSPHDPNAVTVVIMSNPSNGDTETHINDRPTHDKPTDYNSNDNSGSSEATVPIAENPKTDQNNGNNNNEADAIVPIDNNAADISKQEGIVPNVPNVPNVSEPTTVDASSDQTRGVGTENPVYDIDIRFGDSNNNGTNQKPVIRR